MFKDGSIVDNIEAIIFATGYKYDFPFLNKEFIKIMPEDKDH